MRRLHQLNGKELIEWSAARLHHGQERYGQSHRNRYGLVDVVEELHDAVNILYLTQDRLQWQGAWPDKPVLEAFGRVRWMITQAREYVRALDKHLPDATCTDERGGERIWWPGKG